MDQDKQQVPQQPNIQNQIEEVNLKKKKSQGYKKSFCRYFLRGLCLYQPEDCQFSHGVADLDHDDWQGQEVEFDYLKDTDFNQKKTIKGPRIYKNLYEFQTQKIFTIEELNEDRAKRQLVRNMMHQSLFEQFMQLLQSKYPEGQFSEEFLIRQYTRAGFNKLMTRIKFSHLTNFLCDAPNSNYIKHSLIMPPHLKKQRSFIVRKAQQGQIIQFYRQKYQIYLTQNQGKTIDQSLIKKALFNTVKPSLSIPPLNIYLKIQKKSFIQFLKMIKGEQIHNQITFQATPQMLVQTAIEFLQKNSDKLNNWNDVFKWLSNTHKINNGNILNQIKPSLIEKGYLFLNFPMTSVIFSKQQLKQFRFKDIPQFDQKYPYKQCVCPCKYRKMFPQQQLLLQIMNFNEPLPLKESFDIHNWDTLIKCAPSILRSTFLGVDLQGRLRKNGYVEMIQLNNGTNTFLFDIYQMDLNGDVQTFQLTKKVLRNTMSDPKILKIFHDSRHDSLALHEFMNCCIVNIFDTSASETFINLLDLYEGKVEQKGKKLKAKDLLARVVNVKTPGLNQILAKYKAPHGINKNKDRFHNMWKKGQTSLFDQRPLDPDYRQYCIKDVLDLPYLQKAMSQEINVEFALWISSQYVKWGFLSTQEGQDEDQQTKKQKNIKCQKKQQYSEK